MPHLSITSPFKDDFSFVYLLNGNAGHTKMGLLTPIIVKKSCFLAGILLTNDLNIFSAECGDYVIEDYPDHTYLSSYKFVPHQDHELERKIMENHKKHM